MTASILSQQPAGHHAPFGGRPILLIGAIGTLLFARALWSRMHQDVLTVVFLGQLGFAAFNATGSSLSITVLSEMVPTNMRCSAVALSYNLGDGSERHILFEGGVPVVTNTADALDFGKTGDLFRVRVGRERYDIPEAIVNGR